MVKRPRKIQYSVLLQLRVTEEMAAEIDAEAMRAGLSKSDAVRQLITIGLNTLKK